jgi:uncharacterized repeat protein (TIGR04002 family)
MILEVFVMDSKKLRYLTLTGLFAAMIYVTTAYLHIPTNLGYTHFGDGLIFLAASILPTPYAAAAGAIGGALADGLSGFVTWMPATVIIKAVTALFFTSDRETVLCKRNLIALLPSLALCICGYSFFQAIFMTDGISAAGFAAAFSAAPSYCIQIFGSSVVYIVLGKALDKIKIKQRFGFAKKAAA